MPFINTKVSCPVTPAQEASLKEAFGKAVSLLPGKSEAWLMLNFEQGCHLYFKGDGQSPAAMVEASVFGTINAEASARLSAEICRTLQEILHIQPDRIYIKYVPVENWGWNGGNF